MPDHGQTPHSDISPLKHVLYIYILFVHVCFEISSILDKADPTVALEEVPGGKMLLRFVL